MKKLFFLLCLLGFYSCTGYAPIFSTENSSFYIEKIINTNDDEITKKISKNLNNKKLKDDSKKNYTLKVSADKEIVVVSRDPSGDDLTYEIIINVVVDVFYNNEDKPINTLKFSSNFSYNNQKNKFNLNQYRKTIEENMIDKISQDIVVKLQTL
jgi:outer membrane lipopolysaccharide assembly protein LptE/RlpB